MKIYKVEYEMATKQFEVFVVAPTLKDVDEMFTRNYPNQVMHKVTVVSDKVLNYWNEVGI